MELKDTVELMQSEAEKYKTANHTGKVVNTNPTIIIV